MISITDKGAEKVREFLEAQQADVTLAGLRVGVRGGDARAFSISSPSTSSARATSSSKTTA